ncbi:MAG: PQQ-dependent sugar dehydrogenase [Gammaproteobacteria bacterium]|nr:PQQ-dependent sugar dehydrogenase [Gammaproteobacteria bacterium]
MKKLFVGFLLLSFASLPLKAADYQLKKIASGLGIVWGMDFISNNEIMFTQRSGEAGVVNLKSNSVEYLDGVPTVLSEGQGGLLDVAVNDNQLYFTYSKPVQGGSATTLASAQISNNQLINWKDLLITSSVNENVHHYGSRIAISDQHLYISIGDRGVRENAQDLSNHAGKILRLNLDGSTPKDNPFVDKERALDEIWSYGHRNPQGLVWDQQEQRLWAIEHGPRGGDEINLIKEGANYGWPVISYGKEYWGPVSVGEGTHRAGMEQPTKYYVPSIAPSDLVIYKGDMFELWAGDLLTGALRGKHINKISLNQDLGVDSEERLLTYLKQRIRSLLIGKQGRVYFSTDQGNIYALQR